MSCNRKLIITQGDSKNIKIVISQGDPSIDCIISSDLSGTITSIPITTKNSSVLVPGEGYVILCDAASNQETIEYTAVSGITDTTYNLTIPSTALSYNFYEDYSCEVDGGRVDISSDTIVFEADDTDGINVISRTGTLLNGPAGLAIIELTSSDTNIPIGQYYYSIEWQTSGGGINTMVTSILEIIQDII